MTIRREDGKWFTGSIRSGGLFRMKSNSVNIPSTYPCLTHPDANWQRRIHQSCWFEYDFDVWRDGRWVVNIGLLKIQIQTREPYDTHIWAGWADQLRCPVFQTLFKIPLKGRPQRQAIALSAKRAT